jgi:hypothetical protein
LKPLIKPRFIGRLGNNLFQISACIGYAKKHNVGWGVKKGYVERGFNANQVDKYLPQLPSCDSYFKAYKEFQEEWAGTEFNYHEIPFHPNGCELVGFWQSEKYFENAKDEVRKWINLPFVEGYRDYVSIHVRRGDYTQHSGSFPPVNEVYLNSAIKKVIDQTDIRKFIFFSDDLEWCKNYKFPYNEIGIKYSEGLNEWEDLSIMASCGHNIIANSSFSWWGSWLNTNPNKIVISPSHKRLNWFGMEAGVKHDCVDLLPNEWIQIEFR